MNKCKLGDVASVIISNVDKKSYENEIKVKLCNFTDVYYNWAITLRDEPKLMIATATNNEICKYKLHKGDVAITKDSETKEDIGQSTLIADEIPDMLLGYHCALIRPNTDKLLGAYLNAVLHTKLATRYFELNASGSGQRYTLSVDAINDFQLYLPSINEQERISKILTDIDRKIENNTCINDNLEAQAITLFNEYFMFEIENAEHTFGEYVSFAQGTQVPVDEQLSSNKPNTVRFVRIIDYTTDGQEPPRYIYPPNNSTYINDDEVAVVRYGNIGLIGRRFSGIIANNLFKVVPKNLEITNHFIYYYLNHPKIQRILKSSEESSAMPAIKHSTVANLPINSINSEQLHLFELFASKIERVIVENKGEIVSLSQMSTNILSSLASLSR